MSAQNAKDSIVKNVGRPSPQYIDQYQIKTGAICCNHRQTNFMKSTLKENKTSVRLNVVNVIINENQCHMFINMILKDNIDKDYCQYSEMIFDEKAIINHQRYGELFFIYFLASRIYLFIYNFFCF